MDLIYVIKSLSHENRLRIINLLKQKELCVCEIESIMGVTQSNASRHLNKLKQAGIIKSEQRAQWVYYHLNNELLSKHTFLKELIVNELDSLEICKEDIERFNNYQESGLSCEDLSNDDIDLSKINFNN